MRHTTNLHLLNCQIFEDTCTHALRLAGRASSAVFRIHHCMYKQMYKHTHILAPLLSYASTHTLLSAVCGRREVMSSARLRWDIRKENGSPVAVEMVSHDPLRLHSTASSWVIHCDSFPSSAPCDLTGVLRPSSLPPHCSLRWAHTMHISYMIHTAAALFSQGP